MQSAILLKLTLLVAILLAASVAVCDARGGRRGGGSLGGIFGGLRKYKKPVSTGNSRRTTNGSPMHTPITTATGGNIGAGGAKSMNSGMQSKMQASYPRAQQSPGAYSNLPPGGAYYANTAAMPAGAFYYAQPPLMQSSSGSGDFLIGMMAGHVLSNGLYGHRHHVNHIYQQTQQPATENGGPKVIIVNNEAATPTVHISTANTPTPKLWPTVTDVPLAPFNSSLTPADAQLVPGKDIIFPRVSSDRNQQNTQVHFNRLEASSATSQSSDQQQHQQTPPAPSGGIICVPLLYNETDPNDPTQTRQVEQLVCYPAPAAPTSLSTEDQCETRTVTVIDPSDPTKTVEVQRQDCLTEHPPQIAGEIGESVATVAPTQVKRVQEATAPPLEQVQDETSPKGLEGLEI